MSKNILILEGNGRIDSLCSHIAQQYAQNAKQKGHSVQVIHIGELQFDPILHKGYTEIQALEPDLIKVQEAIQWAHHVVIVYPIWWSSMPALLKGLFDRIWLPGFAFRFKRNADGKRLLGFDQLLKGKTARVIVTLNNFVLLERLMYGDYTGDLVSAVLRFAGMSVTVTEFGRVENMTPNRLTHIEKVTRTLAEKAH